MNINELRPSEGSKKGRRRVGRGHGSGWGKTAGKGHNGQKQRSGSYVSPAFEGGQMPLIRRIPKRGFSNSPFKKDLIVLNIKDIVDRFEDGEEVSLTTLVDIGIIKNARFIKKYSDEKLRNIKSRKLVKEYSSLAEVCRKLNANHSNLCNALNAKEKTLSYGYYWCKENNPNFKM